MIGERIGNYRIVKLLGEGGMGTVYLAEHPGLGRRAAVKILHADLARNDQMIERFFNEARAANAVGHRGIVEASDFGTLASGAPYIVMEFLDGESLTDRMTRSGRLPPGTAVEIACQAAGALGAAHGKGIIHRDLKPDNLFLVPDPHQAGREMLKVLDFGIAKLAQPPARGADVRTRTGAILGTPRYMSPEQCRDSRDVDHRTDVYSLGVILYEMLSGTPPFVSSSWGELAHMHIGVVPPDLRTRAPDVPEKIGEAVQRALEKDPDARFQSMAELREALEAATASRTLVLPARSPSGETAAARSSRPALAPTPAPAPASEPVPAAEPGMTVRFERAGSTRVTRRTTLASAAAEVERGSGRGRRLSPLAALLLAGSLAAAVAIVARALMARGAPAPAPIAAPTPAPTPTPTPARSAPPIPPISPAASVPVAPAPRVPPPPASLVEGPPAPAPAPIGAAPRVIAIERIAKAARAKPAPRRRSPEKLAAPPSTAPRPPEPLKI